MMDHEIIDAWEKSKYINLNIHDRLRLITMIEEGIYEVKK